MKKRERVTWNYRCFRYKSGEVGVHEAYYKNGKVNGWTKDPMIVGDSVTELFRVLTMIRKDIKLHKDDILDYDKK
jgi:hypothetical protein